MLFEILVKTVWILATVLFFVAMAVQCASVVHHPWATRVYVAVRTDAARHGPYTWYVTLWLVSMFLLTVGIVFGVDVVTFTGHWQWIGIIGSVVAAGYSTWMLWPRRLATRTVLRSSAAMLASGALAAGFLWAPGWGVNHAAGFVLAVPVFIAFSTLRARTGAVIALAFALHDGIHVFGTGLMQEFMKPFNDTPFILYVPKTADLWPLSSVGNGDLVVPGTMVVIAGRLAMRQRRPWLLWGMCLGVTVGYGVAFALSPHTTTGFPMLTTLVPCGLIGYAIAARQRLPHTTNVPAHIPTVAPVRLPEVP